MKKLTAVLILIATAVCLLSACGNRNKNADPTDGSPSADSGLGDADDTFGSALDEIGVYDGYFDTLSTPVSVDYVSGTAGAYQWTGDTLTFSGITEDTVYSISGQLNGNIVIDIEDDYELELELIGFSLMSSDVNPVQVLSGNKVTLTAKKDSTNYIYDMRDAVDDSDSSLTKGAIHSDVDLQIGGKGILSVVSENNNGIHTKDDLKVKNLTLTVVCQDNALKGNDSVEITNGKITLISKAGDGIKTTNSDISSKDNQRGTVTISEADLTIYSACDGIDASYNVVVDGENTVLNIYTDKYSNYSEEVTATSSSVYYIRFTSNAYKYSVKYYNSDSDYEWVNAAYHSAVSSGRTYYYYYSFPKKAEYSKMKFFIYSSDTEQGQDSDYLVESDYLTLNTTYDTFALTNRGGSLTYQWTNYTTNVQDMGNPGGWGMSEGNSDKGDHSTKGIKCANEIIINNGSISIKSYDDSLHADNTAELENGESPLGNITVNGGELTLYTNDDGIHAENIVYINGGTVNVVNSYEGVEGSQIFVSGGSVYVYAKDDGINSTATSGIGVTLSGGYVYVYCTGDGIDTNSQSSYTGISFEGGDAVIIANSSGNSAIDTERGYKYTSGSIVAIMPRGGMTSEATNCSNFSSIGTSKTMSLTSGGTLTVSGDMNRTVTMPCSISNALVVILNKSLSVSA